MPLRDAVGGMVQLGDLVWTDALKLLILNNLSSSTPDEILSVAKLGLYTNTPPQSPTVVAADIDPPTWTGYAKIAMPTAYGTTIDGAGMAHSIFNEAQWTSHSSASTTITGIAIYDNAGTVLWGFLTFDDPIPVVGAQPLVFVFDLTF